MAVTSPVSLSKIKTEFKGGNLFSQYVRGGSYVPNTTTNSKIPTAKAGMKFSQFAGAAAAVPVTLTAASSPRSAYGYSALRAQALGVAVVMTPKGGTGTYTWSVVARSITGPGGAASGAMNGNTAMLNCTVTTSGVQVTATATVVWRITATSGGQSAYVDVSIAYTHDYVAPELPSCVVIESFVDPTIDRRAGQLQLGDLLHITDPYTERPDMTQGAVRKSEPHQRPAVRITTLTGATLECSTTAPIATRDHQWMLAPELKGVHVAVIDRDALATGNADAMFWDPVVSVEDIGLRWVQLLYVDNRAFWASSDQQKFILHHNAKAIL